VNADSNTGFEKLKYCVNFAIDISIFVGIFRKIMNATIISPGSKYIARIVVNTYSITCSKIKHFSLCPKT
jgi:hypothetical protein